MSYTKMCKEIEKYLKENNLPWRGKSSDTKEETEKRLSAWDKGTGIIFDKWLEEKRYKELISVAHQGWFSEDKYLVPLAKYFVRTNEVDWLKYLCEKTVRYNIENVLSCLKFQLENYPNKNISEILLEIESFDLEKNAMEKIYNSTAELKKYYIKAMDKFKQYIEFLEQMNCDKYLEEIRKLQNKTKNMTIKLSDMKTIKMRL
jgi:hypothetical protein